MAMPASSIADVAGFVSNQRAWRLRYGKRDERASDGVRGITEDQQTVLHGKDSRMSEVEYRLHRAQAHLKRSNPGF